jgi:guanylate kinase
MKQPLLIIVSAPSGAGKSTLCNMLIDEMKDSIKYSVSCTTRKPRGAEKDGEAYYFLSKEQFEEKIKNNEFLEYAVVHENYYGTLDKTVRDALANGMSILMDIDVQGRDKILDHISRLDDKDILRKAFFDIFIRPPDMVELEKRLTSRGEDTPEVIAVRLRNAKTEMESAHKYMHIIINHDVQLAYNEFKTVIQKGTVRNCIKS